MPDPTGTKFDGAMAFGSQIVAIGAVNFVAEDITFTAGSEWVETKNENGVPTRATGKITTPTGSATLQLEDDETAPPALFGTFTLTPIGGGTAIPVIITEVGQEFKQGEERKVKVNIRKQLAED